MGVYSSGYGRRGATVPAAWLWTVVSRWVYTVVALVIPVVILAQLFAAVVIPWLSCSYTQVALAMYNHRLTIETYPEVSLPV